jgi:hypothetical protein
MCIIMGVCFNCVAIHALFQSSSVCYMSCMILTLNSNYLLTTVHLYLV